MQFGRLEVNNFKSFEHFAVELDAHGFVKIDGVNNTDSFSKSVGSGKSTIADAISYALTGETVKGNSSMDDIKNMYTNGVCKVSLSFINGDTLYEITRGEKELTITEGGKNISKHLKKETEQLIREKFPMFTPTFLGATVIIGQNMPNSFTNNKPSARKQILEELTNSSFMIEEIKSMLADRKNDWQAELTKIATGLQVSAATMQTNKNLIIRTNDLINALRSTKELTDEIETKQTTLAEIEGHLMQQQNDHIRFSRRHSDAVTKSSEYSKQLDEARVAHQEKTMKGLQKMLDEKNEIEKQQASISSEIKTTEAQRVLLVQEIRMLKEKPTHCPTCKQALPDAHEIDTSEQERKVKEIDTQISVGRDKQQGLSALLNPLLEKISKYQEKNKTCEAIEVLKSYISQADEDVQRELAELNESNQRLRGYQEQSTSLRSVISNLQVELKEVDTLRSKYLQDVARAEAENVQIEKDSEASLKDHDAKSARLSVLNQVISFAQRDFRTILLQNIIQRLDQYAKSYCKKMLDTTAIEFKDDGNNIAITFRGRDFGVLSGGESQIVKMCITLALKKTLEDLVGFTTNIMFFDEVLDNCDQTTAQQIIELVSGLELSSLFFISHHEDVYLPVDKSWVVTKTDNISTLAV